MDASINFRGKLAALSCDECGYHRRGLELTQPCPECGIAPTRPALVERGLPVLSRGHLAQLRLISIGLILLAWGSISAIQVAIVMHGEQLSLAAINMPGPKLASAVMVQREIGGQPGQWGVTGWIAVLTQLAGIWLITAKRSHHGSHERLLSLRRLARWSAVLSTSALMGYLLSHGYQTIPIVSVETWNLLLYTILFGELPVNLLLYLYLAQLASQNRQPRLAKSMRVLAGVLLAVHTLCVITLSHPISVLKENAANASLMMGILACLSVPAGVVAWSVIVTMWGTLSRLAWRQPTRTAARLLQGRASFVQSILPALERHGVKLAIVSGLVLWLTLSAANFAIAISHHPRRLGLGGDLPSMNYVGPKVTANPFEHRRWDDGTETIAVHWKMLAVLLLATIPMAGQSKADSRLRLAARWLPILFIGARTGILLSDVLPEKFSDSMIQGASMLMLEAPATFLLMYYLSRVATHVGEASIGRTLYWLAFVAAALISSPVYLYYYAREADYELLRANWTMGSIYAMYGLLSFAVGIFSARAMALLAWSQLKSTWNTNAGEKSQAILQAA